MDTYIILNVVLLAVDLNTDINLKTCVKKKFGLHVQNLLIILDAVGYIIFEGPI